jgi:hypothetical protein
MCINPTSLIRRFSMRTTTEVISPTRRELVQRRNGVASSLSSAVISLSTAVDATASTAAWLARAAEVAAYLAFQEKLAELEDFQSDRAAAAKA